MGKEQTPNQVEKKKRPLFWGVLILLGALVIGGVSFSLWQRENLKALSLVADSEKLAQTQEAQNKNRQEILDRFHLTEADIAPAPSVKETEVPEETVVPSETQEHVAAVGPPSTGPSETVNSSEPSKEESVEEDKIRQYVARLYQLEAAYRGELDTIIANTKAEYRALPEEQRTKENKLKLVTSKMELLIAKEKQCDADVEALLDQIQAVLDEQGSKEELVKEIRAYYKENKATWKAACMTELYK